MRFPVIRETTVAISCAAAPCTRRERAGSARPGCRSRAPITPSTAIFRLRGSDSSVRFSRLNCSCVRAIFRPRGAKLGERGGLPRRFPSGGWPGRRWPRGRLWRSGFGLGLRPRCELAGGLRKAEVLQVADLPAPLRLRSRKVAPPTGCSGVSSTDGDGGSSAEAAGVSCSTAPRSKSSRDGISASPPGSGRPASACSAWGGSPSAPARGSVRLRSSRLGSSMPARTSSDGASMDMASSDGGLSGGASVGMVSSRGAWVEQSPVPGGLHPAASVRATPRYPRAAHRLRREAHRHPRTAPRQATPRDRWEAPRGRWEAPRGRWEAPRGRWEAPRGRWEAPRGRWEAPRGRRPAPRHLQARPPSVTGLTAGVRIRFRKGDSSTAGSAGSPAALSAGPPREGSRSSMGGVVDSSRRGGIEARARSLRVRALALPLSPAARRGAPSARPESRSSRLERSRPKS